MSATVSLQQLTDQLQELETQAAAEISAATTAADRVRDIPADFWLKAMLAIAANGGWHRSIGGWRH